MPSFVLEIVWGPPPCFGDSPGGGVVGASTPGCRPGITLRPRSGPPASVTSGRLRASSLSLSAISPPACRRSSPPESAQSVASAALYTRVAIHEARLELRPWPVGGNRAEGFGGRHSNPPVPIRERKSQLQYAGRGAKPSKGAAAGHARPPRPGPQLQNQRGSRHTAPTETRSHCHSGLLGTRLRPAKHPLQVKVGGGPGERQAELWSRAEALDRPQERVRAPGSSHPGKHACH